MGRTTGYWWAPDEKRIAFTRVDESPVTEVERFEIYADRTQVVKQRYPGAGTPNALVQLLVAEIASSATAPAPVQVDLGPNPDIYLARVTWFPDSSAIAVQRQSRDQDSCVVRRTAPGQALARGVVVQTDLDMIVAWWRCQIVRGGHHLAPYPTVGA